MARMLSFRVPRTADYAASARAASPGGDSKVNGQAVRRLISAAAISVLVVSCTEAPFDLTVSHINYDGSQSKALVELSDPQIFRREALINDRYEEITYLKKLREESVTLRFEPELLREIETISSFAARLGVKFDPAAGTNFTRANERSELEQEVQVTRLQAELASVRRDLDILRDTLDKRENPALTIGNTTTVSSPTSSVVADPEATNRIISQLDSLIGKVTARLDAESKAPRTTAGKASPRDEFRDRQAYRADLRSALASAELDDLHDVDGASLFRMQFHATVFPGRRPDQVAVLRLTAKAPELTEKDLSDLYAEWLGHVAFRLNERSAAGKDSGIRRLLSLAAVSDLFDQYPLAVQPVKEQGDKSKPNAGQIKTCDNQTSEDCLKLEIPLAGEFYGLVDNAIDIFGKTNGSGDKMIVSNDKSIQTLIQFRRNLPRDDSAAPQQNPNESKLPDKSCRNYEIKYKDVHKVAKFVALCQLIKHYWITTLNDIANVKDYDKKEGLGATLISLSDICKNDINANIYDFYKTLEFDARNRDVSQDTTANRHRYILNVAVRAYVGGKYLRAAVQGILAAVRNSNSDYINNSFVSDMLDVLSDIDEATSGIINNYKWLLYQTGKVIGVPGDAKCQDAIAKLDPGQFPSFVPESFRKAATVVLNEGSEKGPAPERTTGTTGATAESSHQVDPSASPKSKPVGSGRVTAYAVVPQELAQRISSVARAGDALQIAASVAGSLPSSGVAGDVGLGYLRQAIGKVDAIERVPLIIGFSDSAKGAGPEQDVAQGPHTSFGWVLGPRVVLDAKHKALRLEHGIAAHDLTADLSIPGWWPRVEIEAQSAWIANWRGYSNADIDIFRDKSAVQSKKFLVPLRHTIGDMDGLSNLLAGGARAGLREAAEISTVVPSAVSVCAGKVTFLIEGANVWRGTEVYLLGLRNETTWVLPDMAGIAATFDFSKLPRRPSQFEEAKLIVWTRNGKAEKTITLTGAKGTDRCGEEAFGPVSQPGKDDPQIVSVIPPRVYACDAGQEFVIVGKNLVPGDNQKRGALDAIKVLFAGKEAGLGGSLASSAKEGQSVHRVTFPSAIQGFGGSQTTLPLSIVTAKGVVTKGIEIERDPDGCGAVTSASTGAGASTSTRQAIPVPLGALDLCAAESRIVIPGRGLHLVNAATIGGVSAAAINFSRAFNTLEVVFKGLPQPDAGKPPSPAKLEIGFLNSSTPQSVTLPTVCSKQQTEKLPTERKPATPG